MNMIQKQYFDRCKLFLDENDDPRSKGLSDFEKFIERDERAVVKTLKKLNMEDDYDEIKKKFPTLEVKPDRDVTDGYDAESILGEQKTAEMVPLSKPSSSEKKKVHIQPALAELEHIDDWGT